MAAPCSWCSRSTTAALVALTSVSQLLVCWKSVYGQNVFGDATRVGEAPKSSNITPSVPGSMAASAASERYLLHVRIPRCTSEGFPKVELLTLLMRAWYRNLAVASAGGVGLYSIRVPILIRCGSLPFQPRRLFPADATDQSSPVTLAYTGFLDASFTISLSQNFGFEPFTATCPQSLGG